MCLQGKLLHGFSSWLLGPTGVNYRECESIARDISQSYSYNVEQKEADTEQYKP